MTHRFNEFLIYTFIIGFILLMAGFALPSSQVPKDGDQSVIARILKEETARGHYSFTATLENHQTSPKEFFYRFHAEKTGKSGTSNSNQSGSATVKPGKTANLSNLTLNLDAKDQWKIMLAVYVDDILVAADTLSQTP